MGLGPEDIKKEFPHIIYGINTPRGMNASEDNRDDYLIWMGEAGKETFDF